MKFKIKIICLLLLLTGNAVFANTEPTVQVKSSAMRPGTTLMDVVYQITDPDDATVKVRALAFIDGVRSFANVIKPVTWADGTEVNVGDAVTTGVDHTLTWNVGEDWDIDLGQVKFEVLCRDSRGLLAFDWVTIPAAGGHNETTISKNSPTDAEVLNALFWQYAAGDTALSLSNGVLRGNANAGVFDAYPLVDGTELEPYAPAYVFKQMNLQPAAVDDIDYAQNIAHAGLSDAGRWHALNKPYTGTSIVLAWGNDTANLLKVPAGLIDVTAIAAGGGHSMVLTSNRDVYVWETFPSGLSDIPDSASNVISVAAGSSHNVILRSDGKVIAWGNNNYGQCDVPAGLSNITAVAAGEVHSMALKNNGTVVAWGNPYACNVPAGLSNVTAIAAGAMQSMALKNDGTVVSWSRTRGGFPPPAGLSNVTAIAIGDAHALALKNDHTIVAWGANNYGETDVPTGLSNVTAIAAGNYYSMALKDNGIIIAWGRNDEGQCDVPVGLSNVTAIAAGEYHSLALKVKQP